MSRIAVFCVLAAVLVAGASAGESGHLSFFRAPDGAEERAIEGTLAPCLPFFIHGPPLAVPRCPCTSLSFSLYSPPRHRLTKPDNNKKHTTNKPKQTSPAPSRKLLAGASNVAVAAPGTSVQVTPAAVAVKAPANTKVVIDKKSGVAAATAPGTQVLATKDAVAVKAPANTKVAVDKKTGDVAVAAPGTTVVANRQTGVAAISAPGTEVVRTPTGTAVSAPFTTVLTGDAAVGYGCRTVVRVPIIGLNFCGDRRRMLF